ncbi:MAG: glutamine synthetase family protein [Actinomycetota bacterium]
MTTRLPTLGDPMNAEVAADLLVELNADQTRLLAVTFIDNSGIARVKGVPLDRLAEVAQWGVGFSPVADVYLLDDGFTESPSAGGPVGDLRLLPDLGELARLPAQPGWAWAPADRVAQSGVPHPQCHRHVLREQCRRLAAHGWRASMAFELEWMLSIGDGDEFIPATTGPAYGMTRMVELSDYCVELAGALDAQGLHVQQLHPEYAAGQFEVSVAAAEPLAAADHSVLARQTIRAVGQRHGMRTTFAPSVTTDGVGNGMHLHFSMWDGPRNLAADGDGPFGMTTQWSSFLAGVLDRLPEMLAVTAPSVASYMRLQPGHWSAPFQCWGPENREAALRIVPGASGQWTVAANAEVKTVDATASPYLVAAVVIAAGLDGVERELTLPPPVEVDPGSLDAAARESLGIERLPTNLAVATDRFTRSDVLRAALGEHLHETLVAVRRAEMATFADADDAGIVDGTRWRH